MKKLLIVLLAAMMVLSLAAVSMATPTVGGELKFKLVNDANKTAAADKEAKLADGAEGKVTFTTNVSDSVTGFAAVKFGDGGKGNFYADEYYMNFAQNFGTLKLGFFGYKTKGNVDVIDPILKDLKADVATTLEAPIGEAFKVRVFYAIDGQTDIAKVTEVQSTEDEDGDGDVDKDDTIIAGLTYYDKVDVDLLDGAYSIGLGYAVDMWGVDVNIAETKVKDVEPYTIINAYVKPTETITAYINYGMAESKVAGATVEKNCMILGGLFQVTDAFSARLEYDLQDDQKEAIAADHNRMGLKLAYKAANAVTYELKYTDVTKTDKGKTEVSAKVAF